MGAQGRGFSNICGMIFTISKFVGVFPFSVTFDSFRRANFSLFISLLGPAFLMYVGSFSWEEHVKLIYLANQNVLSKNYLVIPRLALALVSPTTSLWLVYKIKQFRKVVKALLVIERTLCNKPEPHVMYSTYIMAVFCLAAYFSRFWFRIAKLYKFDIFFIFHVFFTLAQLMILQFCSIMHIIRDHYSYILRTLDKSNAEKWAKCQEVLGSCCITLCECYSPQLVLFFGAMYSLLIVNGFSIVIRLKLSDTFGVLYFSFWILYEISLVCFVLYSCRDSTVKVTTLLIYLYFSIIYCYYW